MRADAVVVGGGPAGATTAILLARAGLEVLLLDRRCFPRAKPCGDCLSPNATRLLDRLDVLDAVLAERPARLAGWRIVSPNGHRFETRFDEVTGDPLVSTALALPRERLDAVLLDHALAAGAGVRTGCHVTGLRHGGGVTGTGPDGEPFEVRARLTVGADGLRSVIARRAGAVARPARLRKVSLTAHFQGHLDGDAVGEMHLADGMCAGLAPVAAGPGVAFNLTLVADADRFGREIAADAASFFRRALRRFPALPIISDDTVLRRTDATGLLASGPFDVPVRFIARDGLALAGDAAGYYDPFTGQGINHAIECGFLLAADAAGPLRADTRRVPSLGRYARRVQRRVRGVRAVQRMIESVLSRSGLADRAIARLAGRPAAARALIAATGDLAPPASLLSPAVLLAWLASAPGKEPA